MPADPPAGAGERDAHGLPRGLRHDIINALNAINGFAAILEMDVKDPAALEFVQRIRQAGAEAMRLAEMIPSSRAANLRVLFVSTRTDADDLALALDNFGCEATIVDGTARAAQALRRAPKSWDLVLVEPDLAAHPALVEALAESGLPAMTRDPALPAATLILKLREQQSTLG